jgi:hypothetical protein
MGDAVLGLVVQQMKAKGETVPTWLVVRNVSDPQIKDEGNIQKEKSEAGEIYKAFGRWSLVCSAIVCCALIT